MIERAEHPETRIRKFGPRGRFAPRHRSLHEVHVTKSLGPERNEHLVTFIRRHITQSGGRTEDRHGVPLMLFERKADAQRFANELVARLNIHKEHVVVKPRKSER